MGSYTSVMNDTEAEMFIKYAPNSEALTISGIVLGVFGLLPVAPVVGAVVGVAGVAVATVGMKDVSTELKKRGLSKIPPGGKYISEKLSLSLVHQADIMLVQTLDDKRISIKRGSMTVWSGETNNSTKRYNVSECSFDEEQELATNNEEGHSDSQEEEHPDNEQGKDEQSNNEEGAEEHPQNEEERPDNEQGKEEQTNNGEGEEEHPQNEEEHLENYEEHPDNEQGKEEQSNNGEGEE